jgi:hypothetical protein
VQAHVAQTVASTPELVQISTAYGGQKEGSPVLPRNKYTAIREEKPKSKDEAKRPEFKVCKFTTEAIVTEGSEVGTIHKVCANPACPVHHPKQQTSNTECGNPEGISKECGTGGEPVFWLSMLSILCHFHGPLWNGVSQIKSCKSRLSAGTASPNRLDERIGDLAAFMLRS